MKKMLLSGLVALGLGLTASVAQDSAASGSFDLVVNFLNVTLPKKPTS